MVKDIQEVVSYRKMCGNDPLYYVYLDILKIKQAEIPGFRDTWLNVEEDGKPSIYIYAREANITQHPTAIKYAKLDICGKMYRVQFSLPEQFHERLIRLYHIVKKSYLFQQPSKKWEQFQTNMAHALLADDPSVIKCETEQLTPQDVVGINEIINSIFKDLSVQGSS